MKSTPYKRQAAPKPKFARGTRASFQSCIDPNINGTGLVVEAKYFPKDGRFLYTVEHDGKRHTFFEEEMAKPNDLTSRTEDKSRSTCASTSMTTIPEI